jgi:hypothetical protein
MCNQGANKSSEVEPVNLITCTTQQHVTLLMVLMVVVMMMHGG